MSKDKSCSSITNFNKLEFGFLKLITIFAVTKQTTMKITKDQMLKMERAARREADIQFQTPRVRSVVHKSKKDYSRQENKRMAKGW
jgi:uncharacterized C2H2 Zn-finger protein